MSALKEKIQEWIKNPSKKHTHTDIYIYICEGRGRERERVFALLCRKNMDWTKNLYELKNKNLYR